MELRDAIRCGDIVKIKMLLEDNVSGKDAGLNMIINGGSALHLALGTRQVCVNHIFIF